jgi:hypothetical protein
MSPASPDGDGPPPPMPNCSSSTPYQEVRCIRNSSEKPGKKLHLWILKSMMVSAVNVISMDARILRLTKKGPRQSRRREKSIKKKTPHHHKSLGWYASLSLSL